MSIEQLKLTRTEAHTTLIVYDELRANRDMLMVEPRIRADMSIQLGGMIVAIWCSMIEKGLLFKGQYDDFIRLSLTALSLPKSLNSVTFPDEVYAIVPDRVFETLLEQTPNKFKTQHPSI